MVPDERASLDDAAVDGAMDDAPLDAEASVALIDAQRVRVAAVTAVDGRLLFANPRAERFGIGDFAGRQTGGLSSGQKRRLAVALALVGRPRLVLLD